MNGTHFPDQTSKAGHRAVTSDTCEPPQATLSLQYASESAQRERQSHA
jgi:hypothetical protein